MSALCVSAADTCEVTVTVSGDNGKAGDVITVTATIDGFETLYSAQVDVMYDNSKVVLWNAADEAQCKIKTDGTYTTANAKKALAATVGEDMFDDVAYDGDYEECEIWGQYVVSCNGAFFSYSVSAAGSDADQMPAIITDGYKLFDLTFVRLADGTAGDTGIAIATNNPGNPDGILANASSTALGVVTKTLNYVIKTPVVDEFINDVAVTGGTKAITIYGRVGAEWLDQDYGVEFSTNKAGTRPQKFYGAKNGNTVALDAEAGTTQTFEFDGWDGTFEIVLTNIAEAGEREYKLFVGDDYTAAATVVVE
ncbi:MAG: hypothetical protein IKD30_07250 [Peptococcaceae bacterium]|nr:hypothetical protein [Peptococcaceae bacterium]